SSRIRQSGFDCQVKDIFSYSTIEKLLAHLSSNRTEQHIQSEQGLLEGALDLLPIQEWFIQRTDNGALAAPNHWNQSFLVKVPELDTKKLSTILEKLVAHHDMLRVHYIKEDWQQVYRSSIEIPELKTLDISKHSPAAIQQTLTDWQSGFDLGQGPLFQMGYLYGYSDGSARLYFALHHMIVDTVSWRILTQDIQSLYQGKELPAKGSSYRQWTKSVKKYPEQYPEETSYWADQLSGMPTYPIHGEQKDEPSLTSLELNKTLTKSLLHKASKAYRTEINDLLLTALAYALKDSNGNNIQGITLEGHGRENIDPSIDHSHTVGWFTSMFPVKLELQGTIRESIQSIKENLRKIPNKGIGFGTFAREENTGYTFDDLAPISFNYLGQFDQKKDEDWQILSEASGANVHPSNSDHNLININGMVIGGELQFHIVAKMDRETTKELGDSLQAHLTTIIEHCTEKLEKEGSSYTPSDFKSVQISQLLLDTLLSKARANQNELAHIYPANSLQQGFIYHALSQSDDDAYRVQVLFDYHQAIDVDLYIKAWEACIAQYPILRTAFNWEEDIIQVIYKEGQLQYQLHDISGLTDQKARDKRITEIQAEDREQAFDLTKPTLLRLHIIKQATDYYTILKTEHHSISDGWSSPVLFASLHEHYHAITNKGRTTVKEDTAYLRAQDYINDNKATVEAYWGNTLAEVEEANDINAMLSEPIDLASYRQVEQPQTNHLE
ncbi:condensation domain-containing protein, partial [Sinomicrobium oceani]|uniref:condensation domain-containing protein n=1 Tax=Sinomicrobium oceani TaxID=1150368 RepID=UPI00227BF5D5